MSNTKVSFRNSLNGYNREEVNNFISELSKTYNKTQEQSRQIIEDQKSEINSLTEQLQLAGSGGSSSVSGDGWITCTECDLRIGEYAKDQTEQIAQYEAQLSEYAAANSRYQETIRELEERCANFEEALALNEEVIDQKDEQIALHEMEIIRLRESVNVAAAIPLVMTAQFDIPAKEVAANDEYYVTPVEEKAVVEDEIKVEIIEQVEQTNTDDLYSFRPPNQADFPKQNESYNTPEAYESNKLPETSEVSEVPKAIEDKIVATDSSEIVLDSPEDSATNYAAAIAAVKAASWAHAVAYEQEPSNNSDAASVVKTPSYEENIDTVSSKPVFDQITPTAEISARDDYFAKPAIAESDKEQISEVKQRPYKFSTTPRLAKPESIATEDFTPLGDSTDEETAPKVADKAAEAVYQPPYYEVETAIPESTPTSISANESEAQVIADTKNRMEAYRAEMEKEFNERMAKMIQQFSEMQSTMTLDIRDLDAAEKAASTACRCGICEKCKLR